MSKEDFILKLLDEHTDELIALFVIGFYCFSWILKNPIPNEIPMVIIGYYFGKKVS